MKDVRPVPAAVPEMASCWDLLQRRRKKRRLSFGCGCEALDALLGGGLSPEGITEISGRAGCGKTQICLQLLVQAQLPEEQGGLGGRAIFLSCGEGNFPVRRLVELAKAASSDTQSWRSMLDGVLIESVRNADELQTLVQTRLGHVIRDHGVTLVVVDSIAGLVRAEYSGRTDAIARARVLQGLGQGMKHLSGVCGVPFVVVNQVTANIGASSSSRYGDGSVLGPGRNLENVPAMGLCWAECVTNSVMLERSGAGRQVSRTANLLFSPSVPRGRCSLEITAAGVRSAFYEERQE
eukprot:scaffold442_cov268-Pinguiococcus_pyrenoidosus.AAC.68